jgi:hypothetical protein
MSSKITGRRMRPPRIQFLPSRAETIRRTESGAEVCLNNPAGRAEYERRKQGVWARQQGLCAQCHGYCSLEDSRLTSGEWQGSQERDDRITAATRVVHKRCLPKWHEKRNGSGIENGNENENTQNHPYPCTVILLVFAFLLTFAFASAPPALAQAPNAGAISGQVTTPYGGPAASATVLVCPITSSGVPCYPIANLYADPNLTQQIPNPISTDQNGNYRAFIAAGLYTIQVTLAGSSQTFVYYASPGPASGGGGGGSVPSPPAFSIQFANATVTAFQGDSTFFFNPTTHIVTAQELVVPGTGTGAITLGASGGGSVTQTVPTTTATYSIQWPAIAPGTGLGVLNCQATPCVWTGAGVQPASPGFSVQFANSAATGLQSDPTFAFNPATHTLSAQDVTVSSLVTAAEVCSGTEVINAKACYGAQGTAVVSTCSIPASSTTLSCPTGSFTAANVGQLAYVSAAGNSGGTATLQTTISAYISSSQVTLATASVSAQTNVPTMWGPDDTTALQNAFNAAASRAGGSLYIPCGNYIHHGLNFTGFNGNLSGGGNQCTVLYAMAVTNPGKVNFTIPSVQIVPTTGIDMSGSEVTKVSDIGIYGGYLGMLDIAPEVNFMGARVNPATGIAFGIEHSFDNVYFWQYGNSNIISGTTNVFFYGYEQSDFLNCFFITGAGPGLYLSQVNTPTFQSPYRTFVATPTSMTKVNVSGGKTTFVGAYTMIMLDEGASEGLYTISIRDAYMLFGSINTYAIRDTGTGTGALRHFKMDHVYIEAVCASGCGVVSITDPAWDWTLTNVEFYPGTPQNVSPYIFPDGFLDSYALVDSVGTTTGIEFSSTSCLGSTLKLGQEEPTTNCTDFASLTGISNYVPGIAANGTSFRPYPFSGNSTGGWLELGTWTGTGQPTNGGDALQLVINTAHGEMSGINTQTSTFINANIGNDAAAPNLTGISAYYTGVSPGIINLVAAAHGGSTSPTNRAWDIWVDMPVGFQYGHYWVSVTDNASWVPINAIGTPPTGATVVQGAIGLFVTLPSTETPTVGNAMCWKTATSIGYCSTVVGTTGGCTCN